MQIKVETEKKYYCMEPERLIRKAENLGFILVDKLTENDEYFTDIDSEFIRNRTCLRIRNTNNKNLEITFKGKSNNLLGIYCKHENSIEANINDYDNYVELFASLGYYGYVVVNKERMVYEFLNKSYTCHIMIDKLCEIGGFVEFEIISNSGDFSHSELEKLLNIFVCKFDNFKLKEANMPYRDIVSEHLYKKITTSSCISDLYINIDSILARYEKDFYKKYKKDIELLLGSSIKWRQFKLDESINKKIENIIEDYLNNIMIDSNNLLVTIILLEKIKTDKHLVTGVNKLFLVKLFKKLGINNLDIIYINSNTNQFLSRKKMSNKNSIVINNNNISETISNLLILINNINAWFFVK